MYLNTCIVFVPVVFSADRQVLLCVRFQLASVAFIWRTAAGRRCTNSTAEKSRTKRNTKPSQAKRSLLSSHFSLCSGKFILVRNHQTKIVKYIYFLYLPRHSAIYLFFPLILRRQSRCHFVLSLAATFPHNVYLTLRSSESCLLFFSIALFQQWNGQRTRYSMCMLRNNNWDAAFELIFQYSNENLI